MNLSVPVCAGMTLHADTSPEPLSKPMDRPLHFPSLPHNSELYHREIVLSITQSKFVSPKRPVQDVDLIFWEETNESLDAPNVFLR